MQEMSSLILSALEPEQIQERLNEILEKSPIHFDINGEIRNISLSYGIVAFEEKKGKNRRFGEGSGSKNVSVQEPES